MMSEEKRKPSVLLAKAGKSKSMAMVFGVGAILISMFAIWMVSNSDIARQINRGDELNMMQILGVLVMAAYFLIIIGLVIVALHLSVDYIEVYTDHIEGKGFSKGAITEFMIPIDKLSNVGKTGMRVTVETKDGQKYSCFIGKDGDKAVSSMKKIIRF